MMKLAATLSALSFSAAADPLACQPNDEFPMLPIYHLIGNVTKAPDGSIKLEPINDASGVTYKDGIYHAWHQCCQNHWDHAISADLMHWQRLPPPIQPVTLKTWDGSISMLDNADAKGPVMIYDAQDGKDYDRTYHSGNLTMPFDRPILGIARLDDPTDKYLLKWSRAEFNPVTFTGGPKDGIAFPGPIWKEGDHWNFIGQGSLFSSADDTFQTWTRKDKVDSATNKTTHVMDPLGGGHENSGQWMMPVPKAVDGSAPPSGASAPNMLINVGGGDRYVFATWDAKTETLTPWTAPKGAPKTGQVAHLEAGRASWFGASGGTDNNGRMMMLGWATPDFHGNAGPGINFLTRMTLLREVNYEPTLQNLVANPLPELQGLRNGSIASEKAVKLSTTSYSVKGTDGGAASAADIQMTFRGAKSGDTIDVCVLGSADNATVGLAMKLTVGAQGAAAATFGSCGSGPDAPEAVADVQKAEIANQFVIQDADDGIRVRILPDRSVADFFVQGGQVAATTAWASKVPRSPSASLVTVSSSGSVAADIDVWGMGCGWLNPSFTDSPTLLTL